MQPPSTPEFSDSESRKGLVVTALAFFVWGLYPLYWHALAAISPLEVTAHRVIWCTLFVCGYLCWRFGLDWLKQAWSRPATFAGLMCTSALISINWLLYFWAVNTGRVLDVSLGYFVSPLVSVLLGVVLLSERLNHRQWLAVLIAACGVSWMIVRGGHLPWIALTLAFSFGAYGLMRKRIQVEAVPGLGIESLMMFLPALAYLLWSESSGTAGFLRVGIKEDILLIVSGLVTAGPLICYAYGARRLPLSTVGFMQYLAPTLQLLIGVLIFGESFGIDRAIGFSLIWCALALYVFDGFRGRRLQQAS